MKKSNVWSVFNAAPTGVSAHALPDGRVALRPSGALAIADAPVSQPFIVVRVDPKGGSAVIVAAGLSGATAHEVVRAERGEVVRRHDSLRYPNGAPLDADPVVLVGQRVIDVSLVPVPLSIERPLRDLLDVATAVGLVRNQTDLAARRRPQVSQAAVGKSLALGGRIWLSALAAYATALGWRLMMGEMVGMGRAVTDRDEVTVEMAARLLAERGGMVLWVGRAQ